MSEKKEAKQLSEAEILQLHKESDPASDQYKGEPVDNSVEEPVKTEGYYDPTAANIEEAQIVNPDKEEAKVASTEEVTTGKKAETAKAKEATDEGNSKRG